MIELIQPIGLNQCVECCLECSWLTELVSCGTYGHRYVFYSGLKMIETTTLIKKSDYVFLPKNVGTLERDLHYNALFSG